MPVSAQSRGYVGGKYALELDGVIAGWAASIEGGYASWDVVVENSGGGKFPRKHLAGVQYEDITITCGTGMSNSFYDWIKATFSNKSTRKNGAVISADYNGKEVSRLNFFNGLITEVGFPALDAASKDSAK